MRLFGRQAERARVDTLLEDARVGGGGALIVVGEAGIGKTELLRHARSHADGMTLLGMRGIEAESELPFAGLSDLLRPVTRHLDTIPEPQAQALRAALAIGPEAAPGRFATAAATLSVLAAAAEEAPLLVTVDDAQWLDAASAEALLFAALRLESEGIAILVATRPEEGFGGTSLESLTLAGLDQAAAADLLRERAPAITNDVVVELVRVTRGNPLALHELAVALGPDELSGQTPIALPLPVGPSLDRAFLRRVASLPEDTQAALLVAAAAGSTAFAELLPALERLGLGGALAAAERTGLIALGYQGVEFEHPLVRSAVYGAAPESERRRVHGVLAATATGPYADDRRAWHLAAAAAGADEGAAAALEASALRAGRRGGFAAEAEILARAAALTPARELRSQRRLAAARAALLAGRMSSAAALAESAYDEAADPIDRARVRALQGTLAMLEKPDGIPSTAFADAAAGAEGAEPALAVALFTVAAALAVSDGLHTAGGEALDRALRISERLGEELDAATAVLLGHVLFYCGRESEGYALAAQRREALEASEVTESVAARHQLAVTLLWAEEYELAREVLSRLIAEARAAGAAGLVPIALDTLASIDARVGRLDEAYAASTEALQLSEATGQTGHKASFLSTVAGIEAIQGREAECREHAGRALELAKRAGHALNAAYALAVLGRLELTLGRPDEAIRYLSQLEQIVRSGPGVVEPGVVPVLPDLVEAYVRARRLDDARATLALFAAQAARAQSTWALAALARCRGLLASDGDFESHFREALEWHTRAQRPFERARTELCFGERLRRARRHAEAKEFLRSALEAFELLGASPWADRAAIELGERARRRRTPTATALSAKELQVAMMVARGATNREAAAALFLSVKTIEAHLGRVYAKLGVRSRTELAVLLAGEGSYRRDTSSRTISAAG